MTRHRTLLTSLILASLGFIGLALPLAAHHASGPFYDSDKPIEIKGVVTRFVFRNPHAALFLDVTDESGATAEWQVELGAPVMLRRFGWTPDLLPVGMVVRVAGPSARAEGAHMAHAQRSRSFPFDTLFEVASSSIISIPLFVTALMLLM